MVVIDDAGRATMVEQAGSSPLQTGNYFPEKNAKNLDIFVPNEDFNSIAQVRNRVKSEKKTSARRFDMIRQTCDSSEFNKPVKDFKEHVKGVRDSNMLLSHEFIKERSELQEIGDEVILGEQDHDQLSDDVIQPPMSLKYGSFNQRMPIKSQQMTRLNTASQLDIALAVRETPFQDQLSIDVQSEATRGPKCQSPMSVQAFRDMRMRRTGFQINTRNTGMFDSTISTGDIEAHNKRLVEVLLFQN